MDVVEHIINLTRSYALLGAGDAGFNAPQLLMLAGGVIGLGVVMRSTFRRVRMSRSQPRTSARERYAGLAKQTEARHDVQQIMLELDQLARQIHGRIDTRFAKLESVIRDADERIDKLSNLVRQARGTAPLDLVAGATTAAERATAEPRNASALGSGECGPEDRHATVYALADTGLSAHQISARVGQTTGEVELILALRRTKRDAARLPGVHSAAPPSAAH